MDKSQATESELVEAIKGKAGYILGGIEKVTDKVIEAANELKALVFTGADWAGFIPGHELATKRGIAIANTPGANTYSVAEYTLTLMLVMLRRILELGRTGEKHFMTTNSLSDIQIGIIGMGRIGERVTRMLKNISGAKVVYWNRTRKKELETELGVEYVGLEKLLASSDLVSNHLSSRAGTLLNGSLLKKLKKGAIIINTGSDVAFDTKELYNQLTTNEVRAAFDFSLEKEDARFNKLPINVWFCSNSATAYNTTKANQTASDMATTSIINLLATGQDAYKVN